MAGWQQVGKSAGQVGSWHAGWRQVVVGRLLIGWWW